MNVVVLSGGVGGARFVRGVVDVVGAGATSRVIGNVGDDVEVLGLHVSPDLDSILYALAGLDDEERGWGRAGETWQALETRRARSAARPGSRSATATSACTSCARRRCARASRSRRVTARLAAALGVETRLLPATDDRLRTWIDDAGGRVPVPGVVRRARAPRRGRRASASRAPTRRARRPACSRRSPRPT